MSTEPVAIVGMACRFPDAASPEELWENVLAGRQSFRAIPPERLDPGYYAADPAAPDATYSWQAALLTGYEFDRAAFRVSLATFESTDLAHWLALDVAAAALRDTGVDLDGATTGVIVGNTLTGDASRARSLRLRWPYIRRVVGSVSPDADIAALERAFKEPFPECGEDSLAGGLSNTIAGRICNYFGFGGGGYTVDGACASSLLAVAQGCSALAAHDVDAVVAGGVDLSLDPFELIGFAKCSALARERMFVYDRKSNGFLPGEGCGFVVLMRRGDALRLGARVYATIRGWGVSSDGHGGITRPEVEGQAAAIRRAYARAGMPVDDTPLFEGHGTGTPVGDPVELRAIESLIISSERPRYIGSVKANIGHTKAAAGVAGLIKATLAVRRGVIPPTTGCDEPCEQLARGPLRPAADALPWPDSEPRRAGVNAFGFGGINVHLVIEDDSEPAMAPVVHTAAQDAELFVFAGATADEVSAAADRLASRAESMSIAEMSDAGAALASSPGCGEHRLALVASLPSEMALHRWRSFAGSGTTAPRIAFLFSGQGSPVRSGIAPALRRIAGGELFDDPRFAAARACGGTALAQPAGVAASLVALRALRRLGVEAHCAIGHSLGELVALHWAGVFDERGCLALAFARGEAMQRLAGGAMAALRCDEAGARELCDAGVVLAALNAPDQTVVSGPAGAVERAIAAAQAHGIAATPLPVAAAFHSPAMAAAAPALRDAMPAASPPRRRVISTVTGASLADDVDVAALLCDQLTNPVRFLDALRAVASDVDLFLELGAGSTLAELVSRVTGKPAFSVDAGDSVRGLLECVAALHAAGAPVEVAALFESRFTRPFRFERPRFIESPCECLPPPRESAADVAAAARPDDTVEFLRELVARAADLPLDCVSASSRLLADLHLSSITAARVMAEAAQRIGVRSPADPTAFADASVAEAAAVLDAARGGGEQAAVGPPAGVADWVRPFHIVHVPAARRRTGAGGGPLWRFIGDVPRPLREAFQARDGRGVVVALNEPLAELLLDAARALAGDDMFVVVQRGPFGGAFARSLALERPRVRVRVVNVPSLESPWAAAEAVGEERYVEALYDAAGERYEPRLALAPLADEPSFAWRDNDVVLITGGAKGIGAEVACHLARRGVRLVLIGRSPRDAVAGTLARLALLGASIDYIAADVTDPDSLRGLPNVTAVIHAAGTNVPARCDSLDAAAIRALCAPKVDGLRNMLAAIDPSALRLLVTFGSVIARSGMHGEAHYALANEWLALATVDFAAAHPACRTVCMEWSVWSGSGMGERLGVVESLRRAGVAPIEPTAALRAFDDVVSRAAGTSIVLCGRLGDPPTLRFADAELPPLRFLESVPVAIAGVELVAEVRLTLQSDPYLGDHVFAGEPLLPAAVALEAMAQAAFALSGRPPARLLDLDLRAPVTVPRGRESVLRIAALAEEGRVRTVVRASESGFQRDHFRATIESVVSPFEASVDIPAEVVAGGDEIYDALLFHTGRFRRIAGYRVLSATECIAEIESRAEPWFHRYAPQTLLAGDPAVRDAALHAIQACVPRWTVLPVAIASIEMAAPLPPGNVFVSAVETARGEREFVYDVAIAAPDGRVVERWSGLRLRAVAPHRVDNLPPSLWGVLLERELAMPGLRVVVSETTADESIAAAAQQRPIRRGDGKPFVARGSVSASHAGKLTMAAAYSLAVGCDLQRVEKECAALLAGSLSELAAFAASASDEPLDVAATRVWCAAEALKKASGNGVGPLLFDAASPPHRVAFTAGRYRADTFHLGDHIAVIACERREL
jgi:enediyne polyketide synthase